MSDLINTLWDDLAKAGVEPTDEVREAFAEAHKRVLNIKHEFISTKIAMLEARIAELEARDRWIPVSERLPEPDRIHPSEGSPYIYVLVACADDAVLGAVFIRGVFWTGIDELSNVTHWRLLPEPPSQEIEE